PAEPGEPVEIVGGHRLLEPAHLGAGEALRLERRLLPGVGAVGVDEQRRSLTDRLARGPHPPRIRFRVAPDFHFYRRNPHFDKAAELTTKLRFVIRGEAARAVH